MPYSTKNNLANVQIEKSHFVTKLLSRSCLSHTKQNHFHPFRSCRQLISRIRPDNSGRMTPDVHSSLISFYHTIKSFFSFRI